MIELAKAASNEVKAIKSAIHHGIQTRSPTISQIRPISFVVAQ